MTLKVTEGHKRKFLCLKNNFFLDIFCLNCTLCYGMLHKALHVHLSTDFYIFVVKY